MKTTKINTKSRGENVGISETPEFKTERERAREREREMSPTIMESSSDFESQNGGFYNNSGSSATGSERGGSLRFLDCAVSSVADGFLKRINVAEVCLLLLLL